jgi:uridine kinase
LSQHDQLVNDLAIQINALQSTPRLESLGRTVIRSTIDNFHNPEAIRYARGKHSPEGFFYDSHDFIKLKKTLLDPLSPGGSLMYRTAGFNHELDQPVDGPMLRANHGDILLFDGIFLHRPELISYWDFSIFLDVDLPVVMERGARRDGSKVGPLAAAALDPDTVYNRRYIEGQCIYVRSCQPQRAASILVNYNDLDNPYVIKAHAVKSK